MPTVLRIGAYRLFFYSGDKDEAKHIHIEREDKIAKFWLEPVRMQNSGKFNRKEIKEIQSIILEYQFDLIEAWHEYFSDRD